MRQLIELLSDRKHAHSLEVADFVFGLWHIEGQKAKAKHLLQPFRLQLVPLLPLLVIQLTG